MSAGASYGFCRARYWRSTISCLRSRLAAGEVEYIVQVLLRAFQSSLLQTYKSKFTQVRKALHPVCDWRLSELRLVQYLMFYVCAHDTTLHAAVAFCTALVRVPELGCHALPCLC